MVKEDLVFIAATPEEAVRTALAEIIYNDFNTETYDKYNSEIHLHGSYEVFCGEYYFNGKSGVKSPRFTA